MTTGCFLTLPLPKPEQVARYADELAAMGYIIVGLVEVENGIMIRYKVGGVEDAEQPK